MHSTNNTKGVLAPPKSLQDPTQTIEQYDPGFLSLHASCKSMHNGDISSAPAIQLTTSSKKPSPCRKQGARNHSAPILSQKRQKTVLKLYSKSQNKPHHRRVRQRRNSAGTLTPITYRLLQEHRRNKPPKRCPEHDTTSLKTRWRLTRSSNPSGAMRTQIRKHLKKSSSSTVQYGFETHKCQHRHRSRHIPGKRPNPSPGTAQRQIYRELPLVYTAMSHSRPPNVTPSVPIPS